MKLLMNNILEIKAMLISTCNNASHSTREYVCNYTAKFRHASVSSSDEFGSGNQMKRHRRPCNWSSTPNPRYARNICSIMRRCCVWRNLSSCRITVNTPSSSSSRKWTCIQHPTDVGIQFCPTLHRPTC